MAFDWFEFLQLAQTLATKGDEASKRTSISRAYYSVFHLAHARAVKNCGMTPPKTSKHAWCWDKYMKSTDKACAALGIAGDRLKRARQNADYDSPLSLASMKPVRER
jgi:uncharacterized protein (UPF0332 family)